MKFCVIGLGRYGFHVAVRLAEQGMEVLAIDSDEAIVTAIRDFVTHAICMQVSDEESLRAVGIEDVDTVLVSMGENFAQSILVTALLKKQLNIPNVIARATSQIHETILKLVGADKVIAPEREHAIRLANTLSLPFIDLVNVTDNFAITQLRAPEYFVGKTIGELQLRKNRKVSCIGVKKGNDIVLIDQNYVVLENDSLVFAGDQEDLEALARI